MTLLVLLDLSSAFDTIDHDILLTRLSTKFGLEGVVLQWFQSYLKGRSQRISVHDSVSEKFDLSWGVPQGSCLGPLLYSMYASELFNVIKGHLPIAHCYADDTQLYLSFSTREDNREVEAVRKMELCVAEIRNWMSKDKLLMNDDKTEFLIIGTRQQLNKVNISKISIGSTDITPAHAPVRNLGVWLDSNLSMDSHITKTCSTAFYYLHNIRRIRRYLSRDATETLIHAFITSRLDYCNSLFYGIPLYQQKKLQRVQNAAARLIFHESKHCHVTPLLYSLHWLPVKQRIHFKLLLITFKAIHGLAPKYISDLITINKGTRYKLRSNDQGLKLALPRVKTLTTLGPGLSVLLPQHYGTTSPNLSETVLALTLLSLISRHIYIS